MPFLISPIQRFCRSWSWCSFLQGRILSCRSLLKQKAHQFTSIAYQSDKLLISIPIIKPLQSMDHNLVTRPVPLLSTLIVRFHRATRRVLYYREKRLIFIYSMAIGNNGD